MFVNSALTVIRKTLLILTEKRHFQSLEMKLFYIKALLVIEAVIK